MTSETKFYLFYLPWEESSDCVWDLEPVRDELSNVTACPAPLKGNQRHALFGMFHRVRINSLFMVTLIDYLNSEQNGSPSSVTVIFQITVCALLSLVECSTYFTSLFFPGKDFVTENKPGDICVKQFLTQILHPAGAGRFQSPFPDESWCPGAAGTPRSGAPCQPWPGKAGTPGSRSEFGFVTAECSNHPPFLLKCLPGIFSV